jgi:hypothetical protein
MPDDAVPYPRYRFPHTIIGHAVWLYRFAWSVGKAPVVVCGPDGGIPIRRGAVKGSMHTVQRLSLSPEGSSSTNSLRIAS